MATIKESKRSVAIWALIGTLVIAAWFLVSVTQAMAETKTVKYKATSYVTKAEFMPVFDAKGHIIGMLERRGVAVFETGEVAAYLMRATFDLIKRQGPIQGYSQVTYKDGSTTVYKWQSNLSLPPEWKLGFVKGKGEYIKGTGRFEGIKGTVSWTGKFITLPGKETKGDMYKEVTSTYTLPSQ